MSIYQLKSQFQNLLRPISNELVKQGYTANQVTITAIVLSSTTAYIIAYPSQHQQKLWYVLPISLFSRMALNAIDGMMAREHGQASQLGAVLNEVGDLISDSVLIHGLSPHLSSANKKHNNAAIALSLGTEAVAVLSELAVHERANHGPLGKSDRAFELGVIGLVSALCSDKQSDLFPRLSASSFEQGSRYLYWINHALLLKTLLNRIRFIAHKMWQLEENKRIERLSAQNDRYLQHLPNLQCQQYKQHQQHRNGQPFLLSQTHHIQQQTSHSEKELLMTKQATTKQQTQTISTDAENLEKNTSELNSSAEAQSEQAQSEKTTSEHINVIEEFGTYNAYNQTAMFYRYWLSKPLDEVKSTIDNEKLIILLHRGHEHSARLTDMAHAYVQAGYQVFAWDARGNGHSGGERDHADSFAQLIRDLDHFIGFIKTLISAKTEQMLLVASSLGAVIAGGWVHDYAPNIRGMILATPALAIRLYVPFANPALKVAKRLVL